MKSKLVVTTILFIVFSNAYSQTWQLGGGSGLWVHSQNTLKDLNGSLIGSIPFEAKLIDNFPATPYYQGEAGYTFQHLYMGAIYTYNSTGSRFTSSDYSGSYYNDMILSGHFAGITLGHHTNIKDNLYFYFKAEFGGIFSSLLMKESILIKDFENNEENINLLATSIYAKPKLQLFYELKKTKVNLSVGYLLDFKAPFHLENQKEAKIINLTTNEEVKSSWNGFMLGFSIYYTIYSSEHGGKNKPPTKLSLQ